MSEPCPDCGGSGRTGGQVYERISNEGGIWLDVLCPTCQDVDDGEAVLSERAGDDDGR